MGLAKCKACGHEVSKKAKKCPNCGEPQKRTSPGCLGAVGIVVMALVVAVVFIQENADKAPKKPLTAAEQKAENLFALKQIVQYRLEEMVKRSLKDPGSYELIAASAQEKGKGELYVIVKYRARNSFGGFTVNRVAATFSPDGKIISGPASLDE